MISFQPSENNFEMKVQNSYHRNRGATMHFSEARHSEGNIRALRKSQPFIKGDPSCWKDIRLHKRLTPNFGVSYFHLCKQILSKARFLKLRPRGFFRSSKAPVQLITIQSSQTVYCDWLSIWKASALEKL